MNVYTFRTQQIIQASLDEAWDFFSKPSNLEKITPPKMDFKILNGPLSQTYQGQLILYKVKPLFGIPVTWLTEITHLKEKSYFIDEQRIGPYKLWQHLHRFSETENGVLMEDELHFALPFAFISDFLLASFIQKKVKEIFDYREMRVKELF